MVPVIPPAFGCTGATWSSRSCRSNVGPARHTRVPLPRWEAHEENLGAVTELIQVTCSNPCCKRCPETGLIPNV